MGQSVEHNRIGLTSGWLFWVILLAALALRIQLALSSTYVWDEDRDWIVVAESISLDPSSLNLPVRGGQHGAFPAYFMRAGAAIAGANAFGYRLFGILAGVFSVGLIGVLGARWGGRTAGLFAAGLLAFNEYHLMLSTVATERIYYLTFALVSIASFVSFLDSERPRYLYGAMAAAALAFLSKETAAFLLAAGAITLAVRHPVWFRRKEAYLAVLVFIALISPDLWWQIQGTRTGVEASYGDHLARISGLGLTYQPAVFFGRDVVRAVVEFVGRRWVDTGAEYPTMNALMGAVLLTGVVGAVHARSALSRAPIFFFSTLFWVPVAFFTFVETRASGLLRSSVAWNWADLALLPAVLLAALWVGQLAGRRRSIALLTASAAAALCALGVQTDRLGLQQLSVAACPDLVWPADGRFVTIRTSFHQCVLCDFDADDLRLRDIRVGGSGRPESAVGSDLVRGAEFGASDWAFEVRAEQRRDRPTYYQISYELVGHEAGASNRFGHPVTVMAERSTHPKFWSCEGAEPASARTPVGASGQD